MFDNSFIKKYLRENNGEIISQSENNIYVKFTTTEAHFRRSFNGEKEVDGLSGYTLRENDIKFINKMFKKIV